MIGNGEQITEQVIDESAALIRRLESRIGSAIVGQQRLVSEVLWAVLAGGHCLLEGLPGLGKTHLVKALSAVLGVGLSRVQCTPDLMPGDITGSELLRRSGEHERLTFIPGPVFSHLVLVDELNRATPKTQSALLEAMQEQQVTQGGRTHPLPRPFWVIATQNPIEVEGTYPLPEAQLDRFLVKLRVDYPDAEGLMAMLGLTLDDEPAEHLEPMLDPASVKALMATATRVVIAEPIRRAAVDLVLSTHPQHGSEAQRGQIRFGASPRALQAILRTARVRALAHARLHLGMEDLAATAPACLRHRILLSMEAELSGQDVDALVDGLIERWQSRW